MKINQLPTLSDIRRSSPVQRLFSRRCQLEHQSAQATGDRREVWSTHDGDLATEKHLFTEYSPLLVIFVQKYSSPCRT